MNTMITDAAVEAVAETLRVTGYPIDDRLEFARAALEAALPHLAALTPQWQEISTAPRDGSMFLGWVSAERHSTIDGQGSGISADTSEVDFCWWRSCQDIEEGGFYDNAMGQIGDFQLITHWMPMPTPPLPAPPEGEV